MGPRCAISILLRCAISTLRLHPDAGHHADNISYVNLGQPPHLFLLTAARRQVQNGCDDAPRAHGSGKVDPAHTRKRCISSRPSCVSICAGKRSEPLARLEGSAAMNRVPSVAQNPGTYLGGRGSDVARVGHARPSGNEALDRVQGARQPQCRSAPFALRAASRHWIGLGRCAPSGRRRDPLLTGAQAHRTGRLTL